MKFKIKLRKVNLAETTLAELRIIYWFFAHPAQSFTFNDICRVTETAKTTAKLVVEKLISMGLLVRTTIGRLWRLEANSDSPVFRRLKIAYNLNLVLRAGIVEYVRDKHPQARSIILFGSYRKGDDNGESDLDIAVELLGKQAMKIDDAGLISQLGYREQVKVSLHIFSRERIDLNVFANIANGIVLDGFLEVKP